MKKHFLTVLHEGEVMDAMSLDMLKGGQTGDFCICYGCFIKLGCGKSKRKAEQPEPLKPNKDVEP